MLQETLFDEHETSRPGMNMVVDKADEHLQRLKNIDEVDPDDLLDL